MRIGSLCSGYGGLDMAVAEFFDAEVAWFFEYDKAPSKILAHHWPDVPNYGDMTTGDWAGIEQVDIICGGTPCQDLSGAGKRAGMTEGTRSNLWVAMREAVAVQRPRYVVWENVRGAYSAGASSEVESEPGLLGGTPGGYLRALGRVVGDLASLGYDCRLGLVRASDAGAPHVRARVFIVADREGFGRDGRQRSAHTRRTDGRPRHTSAADSGTETIANPGSERGHESDDRAGFGRESADRASVVDEHRPRPGGTQWGDYAPAIHRWEQTLGRQAPPPTIGDGKNGNHRLNATFVEWMMGLPPGHVTDSAIGLTRNEQLKALGNGVVPQQALLALRQIWSMT